MALRPADFKSAASTGFATQAWRNGAPSAAQTEIPAGAGIHAVTRWRPRSELNRRTRICSPLHNHSATRPVDFIQGWRTNDVFSTANTAKPRRAEALAIRHMDVPPTCRKRRVENKARLCRVLFCESCGWKPNLSPHNGAGNETRTRDPDLGKVVLYQLSYSRAEPAILLSTAGLSTANRSPARKTGHAARRYSYPDHNVSKAAMASSQSPT
ncbi:MAG: hypothetical protein JWL98_1229 [Xanthomonadaceae bacterium]|nr:hypothetical protein [Xanthomonadaceae bacterium]